VQLKIVLRQLWYNQSLLANKAVSAYFSIQGVVSLMLWLHVK